MQSQVRLNVTLLLNRQLSWDSLGYPLYKMYFLNVFKKCFDKCHLYMLLMPFSFFAFKIVKKVSNLMCVLYQM